MKTRDEQQATPKSWSISFGTLPSESPLIRCSEEEHIRQCIRACVLTRKGERRLRPQLGGRVTDFLFRPLISDTKNGLAAAIRQAIADGEPRVEVQSIEVVPDPVDPGALIAKLSYQVCLSKRVERMTIHIRTNL